MAKYALEEPFNEYLTVFDPGTGGEIYCVNRQHAYDGEWLKEQNMHDFPQIDVSKNAAFSKEKYLTDKESKKHCFTVRSASVH